MTSPAGGSAFSGPGRFITFEGNDGAGKSTQLRRLASRLEATGHAVTITREPGGSPGAEAIRAILLSGRARPLGVLGEAYLFAAARIDHLETTIRPALAVGRFVLCDRFIDSTRAYQGTADGLAPEVIDELERSAIGATRPDLTLILDLPVELSRQRLGDRAGGIDRFESEAASVLEQRRKAFLDIAAREPARCRVIAADGSADEVADAIWAAVRPLVRPAETRDGG